MKLIDADALIMQMNDGPYNCPGDCGACEQNEIVVDGKKLIACSAVVHAPTINAIPVEWIFEQMQILHELHDKNEFVLQWLMEFWQREQEAR